MKNAIELKQWKETKTKTVYFWMLINTKDKQKNKVKTQIRKKKLGNKEASFQN